MAEQEQALSDEILADARRRADRIGQRAERDAAKVKRDAEKQAAAQRDRILADARQRVSHEAEVMQGRIEQELAALQQQAHDGMLRRVRSEAEDRLAHLARTDEHHDALKRLALLAIRDMAGEDFELTLRPQDRKRWGDELPGEVEALVKQQCGREVRVRLSGEDAEAGGGLLVTGAGGHEVADQTFAARFHRLWDQMRGRIASLLAAVRATEQ